MRFAVAAAGLVAVASASLEGYGHSNMTSPPVYTTEVVTSYTTYCPGPTSVTHNGVTYTVTEATTLTITNCPCTVTKPVYSTTPAVPTTPAAPSYPASSPVAPVYPSGNGTAPAPPVYTQKPTYTGTGAYTPPASTSPSAPAYTGAADKVSFGVAGLLAAAGLIAAL